MMILRIDGLQELARRLDESTRDAAVKSGMNQSINLLQGWIQRERLSGPRPAYLGVITDRLRSSISASKAEKVGDAYIAKVGTNVEYAAVHEFGYDEDVQVRQHARRTGTFRRETGTNRIGRKIGSTIAFFGGTRHMRIPARPFMRPAFEDEQNQQDILRILESRLSEALSGGK